MKQSFYLDRKADNLDYLTDYSMGKNCPFKKKMESHKRIPWMGNYMGVNGVYWRYVNGLRQTDICIRLRDKSFRLWDPFKGEKWR